MSYKILAAAEHLFSAEKLAQNLVVSSAQSAKLPGCPNLDDAISSSTILSSDDKCLEWSETKFSARGLMGVYSATGQRASMEDVVISQFNTGSFKVGGVSVPVLIMGVLDGHGGESVAARGAVVLPGKIKNQIKAYVEGLSSPDQIDPSQVALAIRTAFLQTDDEIAKSAFKWTMGSTASVSIWLGSDLYVANLGDSHTALRSPDGSIRQLSVEHRIDESERHRIQGLGGQIEEYQGSLRIKMPNSRGWLAVPRGFGDFGFTPLADYKTYTGPKLVSCDPDITYVPNVPRGSILVHCCDGVTDVLNDANLGQLLDQNSGSGAKECARIISEAAFKLGSQDNITTVVFEFKPSV